mgnify:CR=1 FL=1
MLLNLYLFIPALFGSGLLIGLATGVILKKTAPSIRRGSIRVGPSKVSGRGVFATGKIRKGAIIERCPTLEVSEQEIGGELLNYVFYGSTESRRLVVMGYGMLFNHSPEPNVAYYREEMQSGPEMVLYALREIADGEELFYNYGEEWWATRQG